MPIIIKNPQKAESIVRIPFSNEAELQKLLADHPVLLQNDAEAPLAFVQREVRLGNAGFLDILLINSEGLPIAVEVKLQRNSEARREVVAQALDYITELTDKTVDELDEQTGSRLSEAIRSFEENDAEFERRWKSIGANLRAGLARLIVAVDGTNPSLERMLRFLAEKSELDVQLVVIEQYESSDGLRVFVGRQTFTQASVSHSAAPIVNNSRLLEAVSNYNETAATYLKAVGVAPNYRQIRPPSWPPGCRTHYEFYQTQASIGAELHIESDFAKPLSAVLTPLDGKLVEARTLTWDPVWSNGRGRLTIRFSHDDSPATIAAGMRELIKLTIEPVSAKLIELAHQKSEDSKRIGDVTIAS